MTNPPTFEPLLTIERAVRTDGAGDVANGKVNALNRDVLSELPSAVEFCER